MTLPILRAWLLAGLALSAAVPAAADLPLKPERVLDVHPERTTWSSLDVSPNGATIVFDVLGDLYAMPAAGGKARQLSQGLAFDSQPRFSPDGEWIAFTSDRDGSENIWIAHPDGSQARAITAFDDETVMVSPTWSADGSVVFASRFRPDLNNYELWRFPLTGKPELLVPVKPGADAPRDAWRSTLDASASADGRWLYYARRVGGLEFDLPTKWTIFRRDLATGEEQEVIAGPGARGTSEDAYFSPRIAADGRHLAYVTRRDGRSALRLRDLATGQDVALGQTQLDAMQASSWQGMVPGMAFTPDGKAIVLSRDGHFERQPTDGTAPRALAREIDARIAVGPSTRFAIREETGPVVSKLAMEPATSPDGRHVAFAALGGIWVQDVGTGTARRLPIDLDLPAQPAWSPDGKRLVFVSWSEADGGTVWTSALDGKGARRIAAIPAYYRYPVFTPGGKRVLVLRSALDERRQNFFEFGPVRESELVELDPASGAARVVAQGNLGGRPQFTSEPGKAYLFSGNGLVSIDLADGSIAPAAQVTGPSYYFVEGNSPVDDMRISPDGRTIAAVIGDRLYVLPRPADPAKAVDLLSPDSPARVLPGMGVDWFEWSGPGTLDAVAGILWSRFDTAAAKPERQMRLTATLPRAVPDGALLLRGARVLTMAHHDQVIENADVLVVGSRIAAVGPRTSFAVPANATIRDVTGKTIMPGFIDVHDHIGEIRRGNWSSELWGLRARLAYGVTTSFDPSTLSIDQIGYESMIDAGLILGPRLRSTGPAVFSKVRIGSLDDARRVLSRYSEGYRLSNIKEYRTGDREVRQWLAMAAREQHLMPTTEGALALKLDLTQILDGYAGNEHALPAPPLGDDVIAVMKAMRTSYDTTLSITNSGSPAMDWIIAHDDPVVDEKLRRFWPPYAIRQKITSSRAFLPLSEERFPVIARDAARLAEAGVLVGMGSHGEAPGIGYHWEMEAHVLGGMVAAAVLHAATAGSAETIGRLTDLGTIEPGKLADLLVLEADPRNDIANARGIVSVMRGGFLFDGDTLRPLWPLAGKAPKERFEAGDHENWLPVTNH
ncbi:amidohydrolase family protein [Novosphingobium album (ex Hu et al. 2023)]|uniref:Amidohydrolase family protein n=1 Tax=Novosphingobium album (ex Hu et al. 2023) TaxID=2930093 RepID=A0ABT0B0E8_9SPHN|nr:amidohydrolase family protein [Novosphingobium album (ex Hu et al. 2023)]MCJ2178395.1 amidohydrolase family protein [Novosphingobium album (ex Hu et al. 2023)]